jgi:VTC domain
MSPDVDPIRHEAPEATDLGAALDTLSSIDLPTLVTEAALQTRTDRKYLIPGDQVAGLIRLLDRHLVALDIDGRRQSRYESIYFDTDELDCYLAAAHGRRRRVKVRTRAYPESGSCMLEVKRVSARGETVKDRLDHPLNARDTIGTTGRDFLVERGLAADMVDGLRVRLTTDYRRATLLDVAGARVTLDTGLRCVAPDGRQCALDDLVVVETKSPGPATGFDRALWARGIRPVPISKYCTGLAALLPSIPANRWHRTLWRHFGRDNAFRRATAA